MDYNNSKIVEDLKRSAESSDGKAIIAYIIDRKKEAEQEILKINTDESNDFVANKYRELIAGITAYDNIIKFLTS